MEFTQGAAALTFALSLIRPRRESSLAVLLTASAPSVHLAGRPRSTARVARARHAAWRTDE